ncbi:hypothetical protein ACJX0J_010144, partial [Zea mays]
LVSTTRLRRAYPVGFFTPFVAWWILIIHGITCQKKLSLTTLSSDPHATEPVIIQITSLMGFQASLENFNWAAARPRLPGNSGVDPMKKLPP